MALRLVMMALAVCGPLVAWACRTPQRGCDSAGEARAVGSWALSIRVPDSVRTGELVTLALLLKNVGDSAIDPHIGVPSDANFVVTRPGDTREVWSKRQSSQIRMGTALKGAIAPGDSVRIEDWWDQRGNDRQELAHGVYCVRGDLSTRGLDSLRTEVATPRILP